MMLQNYIQILLFLSKDHFPILNLTFYAIIQKYIKLLIFVLIS